LLRDAVPVEGKAETGVDRYHASGTLPGRFGEKVRTLRLEKGLSQRELARNLGLASRAYISNLEAGRKAPSLELVVQIADLFGVTTDYLLRDPIPAKDGGSGIVD
jgi:transcriptional regulator with XRE-family HTH domain